MDFSQISLQSRLKKGAAAQVFSQSVYIFTQIASVPLFFHFWGVELYGEWLILFAIPAYFAISDLGFTGVCTREMAILVARGERDAASAVFQSTIFVVMFVSVIIFTLVACLSFVAPLSAWLNLSKMSNENASMVIVLLAAHVFINFLTELIYGGFYCEGHYGLGQFYKSLVGLFEFLCAVSALIMGFGPLQVAAAYALGRFIGTLAMLKLLRKTTPWLTFGIRGTDKNIIRRLISPSIAATAFPIGNALNLQGMRIVVGVVIGPTAVTIFSTLRTLTRLSLMILRSVNILVQPEIGIAYGKEDTRLMRKLHRHSCQVSFWGALVSMVGLLIFGDWILLLWTRGHVVMDFRLFSMLLFVATTNALWFTSLMVPYATNRHQQVAKSYTLVNIIAVCLAFGGGWVFGLDGVAGTLLIAEVVMILYVLPNSLYLVKDNWLKFLSALIHPPLFLLDPIRKRLLQNGNRR